MIENVGYLGQTENIVTESDMDWIKGDFAIAEETPFKDFTNGFFHYNRFLSVFGGAMVMKNITLQEGDLIMTLPTKPVYSSFFPKALKQDGTIYTWRIKPNGDVVTVGPATFNDGEYVYILNNCFASQIIGGGNS